MRCDNYNLLVIWSNCWCLFKSVCLGKMRQVPAQILHVIKLIFAIFWNLWFPTGICGRSSFDLLTVSVKYCSSSFEKRTQIFLSRFKMLAPEQQNISRFDGFWTAWPARFYVVHYLNIRQDQMVVNHKNTEGPSLALLCVADICGALCTSFFLSKCNPGLKKTILRDWLAMLKLNLNVLSRRSTVQYFMMTSWSDTSPVKHTFF